MRSVPKTYPILLLLASLLLLARAAQAVTYHRGRHLYITLLGSSIKFPIFTKEFTEGDGIISVGGTRELWLDDQEQTWGLRLGYDRIRPNGAGLGLSLTYWRGEFADEEFRYDREGPWDRIARYRAPAHTFVFLDLNGIFIPWESEHQALGFYGLISLIGDYEEYYLDRYSTHTADARSVGLISDRRTSLDLRFGFGFGTRIYLSRRFSLWVEKRWIVGERFNTERTFTEGGFFESDKQKTLYAPINSLGLGLFF